MRRTPRALLVAAFVSLVATGAAPPPGGSGADARLRSLAAEAGQGTPLLRIGLDAGHVLRIESDRPYRILDPATGASPWKPTYAGETAVVAEGGAEGDVPRVFRVQVGSFGTAEAAEAERRRVEKEFGEAAVVHHDPDRDSWRVRVGKASDRASLAPLVSRLRASGVASVWIADEPGEAKGNASLRLVDASYDTRATGLERLVAVAAPGAFISVEDKPYRGIVELRVTLSGTVRAIDWVEIENYLLGVVPSELGPSLWPRLDALEAQAVAARTYAWRHRGQFADEGYDLCGTPRCQVYGGVAAEHPLSDRAVRATRGEILTWNGKPISALYTATCGGHTEDAAAMFPGEGEPYLKGVPCRAEEDALASLRVQLEGREFGEVLAENGEDVTRDWALLASAGVVDASRGAKAERQALRESDLSARMAVVARLAGLRTASVPAKEIRGLGEAALLFLEAAGWQERARVLIEDGDVPALLRDDTTAALPPAERRALAYLAWIGAMRPFPDGRYHADRSPTRARLVPALAKVGETYEAFQLKEGTFAGSAEGSIRLVMGSGELRIPGTGRPYLLGYSGGKAVPQERLTLWPGDRVRFRLDPEGGLAFLELRPPLKGVSDDRSAAVYSWEVRRTRAELEDAIHRSLPVGPLLDLQVVRRGVSGRVVEMRVVGKAASQIVTGFDVRTVLDLRDSLMVLETQRAESGELNAVVFSGKGWGHGVGLCQVGAYGMAVRGAGYREILAHYYPGATIEKNVIEAPGP